MMEGTALVFRSMIELLSVSLAKTVFQVTPEGISHKNVDAKEQILIGVDIPMSKFKTYKVERSFDFRVDLKTMKTELKNVKKKNRLMLLITEDNQTQLQFIIEPQSRKTTQKAQKTEIDMIEKQSELCETGYIPINITTEFVRIDAPEYYKDEHDELMPVYGKPVMMPCTSYGQICRVFKTHPITEIKTDGDGNFICFFHYQKAEQKARISRMGKYDETQVIYNERFDSKCLQKTMKMQNLGSPLLQFSYPTLKEYPLKIQSDSQIGIVSFYIKDSGTIAKMSS